MKVIVDYSGGNVEMDAVELIKSRRTNREVEVKIYNGEMKNVYSGNEKVRNDSMVLRTFSPLASAEEIVKYAETIREILRGDLKEEFADVRRGFSLTIENAIGNEDEPDGTEEIFISVATEKDDWKYEEAVIGSLTR